MEKTGSGKHHKSSVCKTLLDKLAKSQLKRLYRTAPYLKAWKRHECRVPKKIVCTIASKWVLTLIYIKKTEINSSNTDFQRCYNL